MTTNKTKPELTEEQRAILNTAFDALGADPADGWFTIEFPAPQISKAVKDGLLTHRENTKSYRISGKGLWMLGKEHPLKAKQAAIEKATEADEDAAIIANAHALLDSISVPLAIDPPRNEAQQAKADGGIAPEDDAPTVAAIEKELATAQEDADGERTVLQAEIRRLQEQVAELITGWTEAEKAANKRSGELAAANARLKTENADLAAERDDLHASDNALRVVIQEQNAKIETLGQAAADGQALMAAAQVFVEVIKRANKTPEASAPVSAGAYHSNGEAKP